MPKNDILSHTDHESASNGFDPSKAILAFYATLLIVGVIIAIKSYAYYHSGSAALLASLIDSLADAVLSLMAFISLRISLRPADENHRFGHGKAESFAALLQSSFLIAGAVFLILEAAHRFMAPVDIDNHGLAIGVSVISVILTIGLVVIQKRAYSSAPSLALKSDELHYKSDILLNAAVIVALLADYWGGWVVIDLITGIGIGMYIAWVGVQIARDAVDMLMDREVGNKQRQLIIQTVLSHDDVYDIHDLRTRKSGMKLYISFDVELDPGQSLEKAHDITKEIDHQLLESFPNAEIIIHKDPRGDTNDPRHKIPGVHY
jgi:ferrous-iron efflux pump FieF